jgi:general secretion pathway protein E
MVGEIRDSETAEIAIQAALTGHLVFSTLHTNDAAGAVSRLLEMGVEDYLLASSLLGVLAQRLVRRICPKCRQPAPVAASAGAHERPVARSVENGGPNGSGTAPGPIANEVMFAGAGCESCAYTGFRGRSGIYELLVVGDAIRSLILKRSSADMIRDQAIKLGMRTLRDDGWLKVREGATTVSEIIRVTQD